MNKFYLYVRRFMSVLTCFTLVGVLVFLSTDPTYSMSEEQRRLYDSGVLYYDIEGGDCYVGGGGTTTGTTAGALTYTEFTVYSPQAPGSPLIHIEGGYESSRRGPDGEFLVRTLDDVNAGTSEYVTLAGDPAQYNKEYIIPTITYTNKDGQSVTLTNVRAVVHDTGSAFTGKPEGRYDVPVGRDYNNPQMNTQTFVNEIELLPYQEGDQPVSQNTGQAGCTCSAGNTPTRSFSAEERYQFAWNFLTGNKGLSEEAAAGVMGNLEAESGIDPHNMQNTAPLPDGPEFPTETDSNGNLVPNSEIRGRYGYGIAQWTTAGRQQNLIDFALAQGRSTGDLGLQLDFLIHELENSYAGVLAKLQEPGVSVHQASDEFLIRFEIPQAVIDGGEAKERVINQRREISDRIYAEYSGTGGGAVSTGAVCSNPDGGVVVDTEATDTTNIACAPGTTEVGVYEAYNGGASNKANIMVCNVEGIRVNSQIAGPLKNLLETARSQGINLTGGGFRSLEDQIRIYHSWCQRGGITPTPPPYPKESRSDYVSCPGGAPPGFSNHEMGFAVDFNCDGTLIPKSYEAGLNNRCFRWLLDNAGNYGLHEWGNGENRGSAGYEAWHWSVDGR